MPEAVIEFVEMLSKAHHHYKYKKTPIETTGILIHIGLGYS